MNNQEKIKELASLRAKAMLGGGEKRIQAQHEKGKLTARERLNYLLDEGSFEEYDIFKLHRCTNFGLEQQQFLTDGVVTGSGRINGRLVFVFSQDFTVFGGSLSETMSEKICKVMDLAMKMGAPFIGINDSGGARIQEGVQSLAGFSEIFQRNILASGVIPQISVIMGPCAGGAVYSPALTDFIYMTKDNSYMFLTGPKVVKTVTSEDITTEDLGGAQVHASKSGVSHFVSETEYDCLMSIRKLLEFLPQNNVEDPIQTECNDSIDRVDEVLNSIIPDNQNKPYDVTEIIRTIIDDGDFYEVHQEFAKNIVVGFAKFDGMPVGVVANQPKFLAGVLDIEASRKAARFVRFCDAFNIPLVTLVDVPGFLPGSSQEYGGVIVHGAKLLFAYGEATVPKVTVTLRKSYGGAHIVMSCKQLRGDVNYAWPSAQIAVMGADGAIEVLYSKEIGACKTPEEKAKLSEEKKEEYNNLFATPFQAAKYGFIDDVIEPSTTRMKIISALQMLRTKRDSNPPKKHCNIPL